MSRLSELARTLADQAAKANIESYCGASDEDFFYDITTGDEEVADDIAHSVEYLELRGKLQRHPSNPNFVTVTE